MRTKLVVAAVLVLLAVAAADALRSEPKERVVAATETVARASGGAPDAAMVVRGRSDGFSAEGDYLHTRVLLHGREYLSEKEIADAFPALLDGPVDIADVVVAPNGTLVLAVYRFPFDRPARAAIMLWRDRRLVDAFTVPPGTVGGGLGFSADGKYIATFASDGTRATIFARGGHRIAGLAL